MRGIGRGKHGSECDDHTSDCKLSHSAAPRLQKNSSVCESNSLTWIQSQKLSTSFLSCAKRSPMTPNDWVQPQEPASEARW